MPEAWNVFCLKEFNSLLFLRISHIFVKAARDEQSAMALAYNPGWSRRRRRRLCGDVKFSFLRGPRNQETAQWMNALNVPTSFICSAGSSVAGVCSSSAEKPHFLLQRQMMTEERVSERTVLPSRHTDNCSTFPALTELSYSTFGGSVWRMTD